MKLGIPVLFTLLTTASFAEDTRQLDSHEHGVGTLNIAIDGTTVAMEFHAPGADIVGFEYAAKSADDRDAIEAAVATLARPLDLFLLSTAAQCTVDLASAGLEGDEDHDEHGDDHADHDDETGHTEFHAEYTLTCAAPDNLSDISFAYFDMFENAREIEVQILTKSGARAFEVERAEPTLDLGNMF